MRQARWLLLLASAAAAQESVRLKDGGSYRGVLVRWDDAGVALRWGPRAELKEWPLAQVADVLADRGPEQEAADAALQAGKLGEAEALYRAAIADDRRGWARDRMQANLVRLLRTQGKALAQGEAFVKLAPRRPDAAAVALAPLRWLPRQTLGEAGESAAARWLAEAKENPLARLLAANWLLDTPSAGAGERELEKLLTDPDARVRPLAMALLARRKREATGKPLPPADLAEFQAEVRKLPSPLRGGPQHVLATMLEATTPPADAALAYLQVPLVHGGPPEIQADALRRAAALTRKAGLAADAAKLEAELAKRFPQVPAAP